TEQFAQRLRYSVEHQHFLALVVAPGRSGLAERVLAERFPIEVRSLDRLLIRHMKAFAAEKRIDWRTSSRRTPFPRRSATTAATGPTCSGWWARRCPG
ncbi:MAG: hypothetical protein WCA32_13875, partial [Chromatiaceae bacterium]